MLFGKHVNKYYLRYAHFFLLGIAALVFVDVFQLKIPDIIGDIIDHLHDKTLTSDDLANAMKSLALIALIMFLGRFTWRICCFGNGVRIECDMRNKLFSSMQNLSQEYFGENKTGALMALYTNDLTIIRRCFGAGTVMLVDAIVLGAMAFIKMMRINIPLALFSLTGLVIVMLVGGLMRKKVTNATSENFKAFGSLSDFVQEDLSGISVIKAFVKEGLQINLFRKYDQTDHDTCYRVCKVSATMRVIFMATLTAINLVIILYGSYILYQKSNGLIETNFTIGELTKFLTYFDALIWPIMAIGQLIDLRGQAIASLKRISDVIDHEVEINDNLVPEENKNIDTPLKGDIKYQSLSFNYPNSNLNVLNNVNFEIKAGEFVGIMGATGAGKTTIVDLLLRIYNIEEDKIYLDGMDIMKLPLKYVRDNISYVPQDNFLYSQTIKDNIEFSKPLNEENNKDYKAYAIYSDIDKDIINFQDGYETMLGERGVTVSGGQKQRISMARALYKDSSILILDDSLSAVDTETEKKIISNLRSLRRGKTTIIIAHRISTLQNLDKIIVVEDGTVTGVGTHDELLKTNDHYALESHLQELEKEAGL
ncbi:MAG: ABC transporter ATP-binding protein [Bacilli bacterium]|nr:ABC transporter ATP-binding protein [Bacilli bacterium]